MVERYGLTETLMNTPCAPTRRAAPGYVGVPLAGVEMRLVADDGADVEAPTTRRSARSPSAGRTCSSATSIVPTRRRRRSRRLVLHRRPRHAAPDGYLRIVGRRATDLIKTGGYKVGAGEIEAALLEHPAVREAAVTGAPDDELGERIVAWVVAEGGAADERELIDHVAACSLRTSAPASALRRRPAPQRHGEGRQGPAGLTGGLLAVRVDDVLDLVRDAARGVLDLARALVDLALVLEALVVGEARPRPPWCGP